MKAILTLNVVYDPSDASDKDIERLLDFLVEHAVGNGMLTGDLDLTVDNWSHNVEVIEE